MFNQKSRLSLALAGAMVIGATACSGGADQSAAVAEASAPAGVAASAEAPLPVSAPDVAASDAPGAVVAPADPAVPVATAGAPTAAAAKTGDKASATGALPLLVVTKSPTCGCCHLWVEHMQKAGFKVEVHDVDDINLVKQRVGVPYGKGSCHTAEVGGYFIEGHVPAEDVKRLLVQKPDAKGLTVPGMPMGSPGMEVPDGRVQPYAVELVARDGTTSPFAHHGH